MRLTDVTLPLGSDTPNRPDSTPRRPEPVKRLADGDSPNVSAPHPSAHAGAQVDAPRHFFTPVSHPDNVERLGKPGAPGHHALLGGGTIVIDGLKLRDVEPGPYCLPPRVVGADAAPARVVLRSN